MTVRLVVTALDTDTKDISKFEYHFDHDRIVVGRGRGADLRLPHAGVSTHHATLHRQGEQYVIVDNNSTNGTFINGARLPAMTPKQLHSGDLIAVGEFAVLFQLSDSAVMLTTSDRSAEMARRIVRELRNGLHLSASRPVLRVIAGPQQGRELQVPTPPCRMIIGRSEHCDLPLSDTDASREHIEVSSTLDGCYVRDLGSKNGILINGKPATQRLLSDGDHLVIGHTELVYCDPADARLKALELQEDQTLPVHTGTSATAPVQLGGQDLEGESPQRAPRGQRISYVDWIIYIVAAVVIGLSIAGLVVLFAAP